MRITRPVKVGQYGVRSNGIEYGMTDPRLQRLHGQDVCLRIDPIDASYVIVCDVQGRPLLRAVNNRLALHEIDQDHVAAGQRAKKRARRLAKEIQDGGLRPATQDITTAAIAAKHSAAASKKLLRATGTDDIIPRNRRPLRSDMVDATCQMSMQGTPPPADDGPISLADLADDETIKPPKQEPALSLADALAAVDGDVDPYADPDAEAEWGNSHES